MPEQKLLDVIEVKLDIPKDHPEILKISSEGDAGTPDGQMCICLKLFMSNPPLTEFMNSIWLERHREESLIT